MNNLKESRDGSLEYIDALWKSQKNIIIEEKLSSLSNLVSRISHELNTPLGVSLTAISYLDDLIKNDRGSEISEDAGPMLHLALSSLQKSISLVETFSEIVGERTLEVAKPVNIEEFINYACRGVKFRNTKFDIKGQFKVNISQDNLSLIIQKIMDNAYDFLLNNEIAGEVILSAEPRNRDLFIKISDNGIGISKKDIKKIFDPLYTTRRGETHHGLGLAIAYNLLITQYHGKIDCLSTIGQGTTVSITIPNVVN